MRRLRVWDSSSGIEMLVGWTQAAEVYDLLFFETEWYRETISFHPLIRQAFGINSNIYHELPPKLDENGERVRCLPCANAFSPS